MEQWERDSKIKEEKSQKLLDKKLRRRETSLKKKNEKNYWEKDEKLLQRKKNMQGINLHIHIANKTHSTEQQTHPRINNKESHKIKKNHMTTCIPIYTTDVITKTIINIDK